MNRIDYDNKDEVVGIFMYLCQTNMDDQFEKEELMEFAYQAQSDEAKYNALCKYMQTYARSDGCFDPAMYEGDPYDMM